MTVGRHPTIAALVAIEPRLAYSRTMNSTVIRRLLKRGVQRCTWCDSECLPPKRTWCSKSCIQEALKYISDSAMGRFVWERDGGLCVLCGGRGAEVDHIIPVVRGGGLCDETNLRVLCFACHSASTVALNRALKKEREGQHG